MTVMTASSFSHWLRLRSETDMHSTAAGVETCLNTGNVVQEWASMITCFLLPPVEQHDWNMPQPLLGHAAHGFMFGIG